jgi:hypothetical protein
VDRRREGTRPNCSGLRIRVEEIGKHAKREASRQLKDREKGTMNELATNNNKSKNIADHYRGINEFKRAYQPRNNLVKDENGDLLADSHSILNIVGGRINSPSY